MGARDGSSVTIFEVAQAQSMLSNAQQAIERATLEHDDLINRQKTFVRKTQRETDSIIRQARFAFRAESLAEQHALNNVINDWNVERNRLTQGSEEMSISLQIALRATEDARFGVAEQRRRIQKLAAEFRGELEHATSIRKTLEQNRAKIALIPILRAEMEANDQTAENLGKQIEEQHAILRAVRISGQAKEALNDIASQVQELVKAEADAQAQLEQVTLEADRLVVLRAQKENEVHEAEETFRRAQTELLVLESEVRELSAEYTRQKEWAIAESRAHVELQRSVRKEKMEEVEKFVRDNHTRIHRVERVQTALGRVRSKLDPRPATAVGPRPKEVKVSRKEKVTATARRVR
jgi:chromosome segregation ATPase